MRVWIVLQSAIANNLWKLIIEEEDRLITKKSP